MLILEERQLLNLETALGIGYKYFIKITKGERGQEKTEDYQPWKQVLEDSRLVSVFFFSLANGSRFITPKVLIGYAI